MNIGFAGIIGAVGMAAGWFIPQASSKTAEYKLRKNGRTLPQDSRFTSLFLKLLCLLVNGVLWAAVGMFTENVFHALLFAVILTVAAVITLVDLRIRLIPNEAVMLLVLLGLILQLSFNGVFSMLIAVVAGLAVMAVFITLGFIMGHKNIGAGDIKLAGAMGLILGFPYIMYALIGMSVVMLVWCLSGLILQKLQLKSMVAFAPFLMAGTAIAIIANISGI